MKNKGLRKAFELLPESTRRSLLLKKFDLNKIKNSPFTFKVATEEPELLQALRLHQIRYEKVGLCNQSSHGLRLSKYQALPHSTILVAMLGKKVIGTLTVVGRGSFGLPIEQNWNIEDKLTPQSILVEFSALAIDPRYRKFGGEILFPLMKYAWVYSRCFLKATGVTCVVHPRLKTFYQDILLQEELTDKKEVDYNFVNAPENPKAFFLDLNQAETRYEHVYGGRKDQNLHNYFTQAYEKNFELPERDYFKHNDFYLTPAILRRALKEQTLADRKSIAASLHYEEYDISSHTSSVHQNDNKRRCLRLPFNEKATLIIADSHAINTCQITNVSQFGIGMKYSSPLRKNSELLLQIPTRLGHFAKLRCRVKNSTTEKSGRSASNGLEVINPHLPEWASFSHYQKYQFNSLRKVQTLGRVA